MVRQVERFAVAVGDDERLCRYAPYGTGQTAKRIEQVRVGRPEYAALLACRDLPVKHR